MSLRRFVLLVMNDTKRRDFPLRRIDASRLFFPKGERPPAVPPPFEDARLPPPSIRFSPPITDTCNGDMEFMLLGGSGGGRKKRAKVVATDHTGRCVLYDPALQVVRALPELTTPAFMSASLAVGDDLYIIDRHFNRTYDRDDCFDGLIFDEDDCDWECHSMPPPPYTRTYDPRTQRNSAHITSYAAVRNRRRSRGGGGRGSSLWVSKEGLGTHSDNIRARKWAKIGDWVLPFWGAGSYIPEHKLWFGLSADEDDGVVCTSDLTATVGPAAAPPAPRILWRDPPTPPEWKGKSSFLVHLGGSRFCLARFFKIIHPGGLSCTKFAVFTGLEVERVDGDQELRMVKHRSHRYSLVNKLIHWVL